MAARQLAAWDALAEGWPVSMDKRTGEQGVYRCGDCLKGVALATDRGGTLYQYSADQFRALIVLHLRAHHAELDPDL